MVQFVLKTIAAITSSVFEISKTAVFPDAFDSRGKRSDRVQSVTGRSGPIGPESIPFRTTFVKNIFPKAQFFESKLLQNQSHVNAAKPLLPLRNLLLVQNLL